MSGRKDIIQNNIRKQLALQSGQLQATQQGGSYQWANAKGVPLPSSQGGYTDYALSQAPARYVTNMNTNAYQLALGVFSGQGVPDELIQVLANMATYYSSQTGQPVSSLFQNGVLLNDFMATINSIRLPTSQVGYVGINPNPVWTANPTLGPTIAAAFTGA
jgi:hypothetical protein